jgi:hypothetical protein
LEPFAVEKERACDPERNWNVTNHVLATGVEYEVIVVVFIGEPNKSIFDVT